jgi:hypothetical protein
VVPRTSGPQRRQGEKRVSLSEGWIRDRTPPSNRKRWGGRFGGGQVHDRIALPQQDARPQSGSCAIIGGMRPILLAVALAVALSGAFELLMLDFWWRYTSLSGVLSLLWLAAAQAACVWWAISTWRWVKTRHDGQRPPRSVRLGLIAVPFVAALVLDDQFGIQAQAIWASLSGETPPMAMTVEADRLKADGPIYAGSAARLATMLETHPNVRVIELSSPGGRVRESVRMAKIIEERGLDTLIRRECHSACVTVFAAGTRRLMHKDAVVGLHSAWSPYKDTEDMIEKANRAFEDHLYRKGVEPRFPAVGNRTPGHDMWINTARQAYIAGLATAVIE